MRAGFQRRGLKGLGGRSGRWGDLGGAGTSVMGRGRLVGRREGRSAGARAPNLADALLPRGGIGDGGVVGLRRCRRRS